ncbi:MAG: hypothetical protein CEE40_11825 [Chloroflexi bacterium B3_Chlor]|nr:MAG: hypothetical protein CEE40_11825 [Chloroflexi bacterium B3_Chlor]
MSSHLPAYAQETGPVARRFLEALKGQDERAIPPLLMPDSEVDWAFRIFGMGPLLFLLYMHLECDRFVLPRFGRRGSREVLVEVGWLTGADGDGKAIYDPRRVSTLSMQRDEEGWRVADLNPAPLHGPISVARAQELLTQVVEQGRGAEPLWFPLGVLTGAFQLKRLGHECLDDVESLFVNGMEVSEFGVPEVLRAVRLWREFKEKAQPRYRRPEVYAAAVEYIMVLFGFYRDSQVEIGARYGVSPSSISSKWHEIERMVGLSQFDARYSIHQDPGAGLEAMLRQRGEEPPPPIPLGTGRGGRAYDMTIN